MTDRSRRPLLLGVDGGNSKTVALVAAPDGTIAGAGRAAGSADVYAVGVEEAVARIGSAVDEALAAAGPSNVTRASDAAGASDADVRAAAFSLAGADWPEDADELAACLGRRWPGARVVNDAIGALRATVPEGPGVVVVLGTGAGTAARGPDGRTWHSSFWQERQGAHELGVRALQAVVRAELGIDPPTALTNALLEATGEPDVTALLHRATGRATRAGYRPRILARVVLDAAQAGDAAALDIVREHGTALGQMAVAAARRVGIAGGFPLALAGGVLRHEGRVLHDAIVAAVLDRAPGSTVLPPRFEPAVGALLLAFDAAGVPVSAEVDARLRATLPPQAMWDSR